MKTPEQLKGAIRNMAAKKNLRAQEVLHTAQKRGSVDDIVDWEEILKDIREEPLLYLLWDNYIADNKYVGDMEFHEVLDTVDEFARALDLR